MSKLDDDIVGKYDLRTTRGKASAQAAQAGRDERRRREKIYDVHSLPGYGMFKVPDLDEYQVWLKKNKYKFDDKGVLEEFKLLVAKEYKKKVSITIACIACILMSLYAWLF